MTEYKRPAVVFNLNNPMQKELYEWCMEQSSNFSDFARTVLFLYKQTKTSNHSVREEYANDLKLKPITTEDVVAMGDLL